MKVLHTQRFPFRYVEKGTLENGMPDYRIAESKTTTTDTVVRCLPV